MASLLRLRCKHTFIDSYTCASDSEDEETRSCPPAFPGLVEQQRTASESEALPVEPPFWAMHVLCRLSCQPLRMSHTSVWLHSLRRLRSPDVSQEARGNMMHCADLLRRAERRRVTLPAYSFSDLRCLVNIVSAVNATGVVLLFPQRNCIVHATPENLDYLDAQACHHLLWSTCQPMLLSVKLHNDGNVSLWDASIFHVRLGIWRGPRCCGGCDARMSRWSSTHPTLILDGCRI